VRVRVRVRVRVSVGVRVRVRVSLEVLALVAERGVKVDGVVAQLDARGGAW